MIYIAFIKSQQCYIFLYMLILSNNKWFLNYHSFSVKFYRLIYFIMLISFGCCFSWHILLFFDSLLSFLPFTILLPLVPTIPLLHILFFLEYQFIVDEVIQNETLIVFLLDQVFHMFRFYYAHLLQPISYLLYSYRFAIMDFPSARAES